MPFAKIIKKKILNSKKIVLKYKNQISAEDKKIFQGELRRKFNRVYLSSISNIVITKSGIPLILNFRLIKDYLKFDSISNFAVLKKVILFLSFMSNFLKFYNNKNFLFVKNAVYLHDRHSANYYHWITDVLPKIMLAKKKIFLKKTFCYYQNLKLAFKNKAHN